MEIGIPTWNSGSMSYSFRILKSNYSVKETVFVEDAKQKFNLPASPAISEALVDEFLEKAKKYFTNPLTTERVLRHLRHTVHKAEAPVNPAWYSLVWSPVIFVVKSGDFVVSWELVEAKEVEAVIPADFTSSTTPRAQSPTMAEAETVPRSRVPEQRTENIRSIQIHDSLIPVGDLPLSDLPPLSFANEETDPAKDAIKRRIREARLKVQLAKLKAQRMEHKYYERYGQAPEESEESSEFSTDSEEAGEELSFERHSH